MNCPHCESEKISNRRVRQERYSSGQLTVDSLPARAVEGLTACPKSEVEGLHNGNQTIDAVRVSALFMKLFTSSPMWRLL
jgi:hypothetical protein